MFSKLSSLFTIFKNFDKIKAGVLTAYSALSKTIDVLVTIEGPIKYLPETIDILKKIKTLIEQYGPLVGIVPPSSSQSFKGEHEKVVHLKHAQLSLNELLK